MKDFIPKSIRIGKDAWKVKFTGEDGMDALAEEHGFTGELEGVCLYERQEIYLLDTLSGVDLIDAFTHELLHALHHTYDFKMPHSLVYALGTHGGRLVYDNFLKKIKPRRR